MQDNKKLLLLRFGELWLKSEEVRKRFRDRLFTNIIDSFNAREIPFKPIRARDRIFIEVSKSDLKTAYSLLSTTFGIVSFSEVEQFDTDRETLKKAAFNLAKNVLESSDTFAVRVKRAGKHEFKSTELEREFGAEIVRKLKNKVNLTNPDKTIFVDIKDNKAYLFSEKHNAVGGLPLGVEGRVAVLFSKDYQRSIVSAFLMMKRGCKTIPLFVASHETKKEKNTLYVLRKYDPLIKPVFIKSGKDAFFAAKESNAKALVVSDSLDEVLTQKTKAFDKETGVFALEPLVGFDDKTLKKMHEKIVSVK